MSNISPRTPPGFGSSSSRFQKKRSDKTPGPGAYTPNHDSIEPKVKGGAFSREKRNLIPSLTGPKYPIKLATMSKINIKLNNCLTKLGLPGAIAVIKDGQIIGEVYSKGFDADTQFQLASVTKQFTAMGILKLVDSRKIDLDTPLHSIEGLIDFPHGDQVTIRHLLNMTSGYPRHFECDETQAMKFTDLISGIKALCEKNELEFSPGDKFSYSNINYLLLTYIIEKISGKSYGDYMRHTVFEPLDMHRTGVDFLDDNVANGQTIKTGCFSDSLQVHKSIPLGAGCLKSTINDMLKWQQCLEGLCQQTSEFISPELACQLFSAPEGIGSTYGFGLENVNQRMHSYEHGGAIMGGSAFFSSKQESSVIVLSNQDQFPASFLEQQARLICFQTKLEDPIEYSLRLIEVLLKQHNVTDSVSLIKETFSKNNFSSNAARTRFVDIVGTQYFQTMKENPDLLEPSNCVFMMQSLQEITTTVIPERQSNVNEALLGIKVYLMAHFIRHNHIDPNQGENVANEIIQSRKNGDLDGKSDEDLAEVIHKMLIQHNKHFGLIYSKMKQTSEEEKTEAERDLAFCKARNYGFEAIEDLGEGGSYLKIGGFVDLEKGDDDGTAKDAADEAMQSLKAQNPAKIFIDLRGNNGGHPNMIEYLASFFIEPGQYLSTLHLKEGGQDKKIERSSVGEERIPNENRFLDTGVTLLTNDETFSAAETFAAIMKHHHHNCKIVGETTGGGQHSCAPFQITDQLWLIVPHGNTIVTTKSGELFTWEGTGITPDETMDDDSICKLLNRS